MLFMVPKQRLPRICWAARHELIAVLQFTISHDTLRALTSNFIHHYPLSPFLSRIADRHFSVHVLPL
jgi:hypothetical protein